MDVSALALMVFSRPLMLGCLRLPSVLLVLSATNTHTHTHTLFSSQTDLPEWIASHLWGVFYQWQLPCSSRHPTLLTAVVGRWVTWSLKWSPL